MATRPTDDGTDKAAFACDRFSNGTKTDSVGVYYVVRYNAERSTMSDPTPLVLASLAEGDKHGYAIMEDIKRFCGVQLGPGTLYGAIARLEQRKLIRPISCNDRRQPYSLTVTGRQHLISQLSQLEQVVKAGFRRLRRA